MAVLVLQTPCHLSANSQPVPNDYDQLLYTAGTSQGMSKEGVNLKCPNKRKMPCRGLIISTRSMQAL